jgi:hypothetical protein
MNTCAIPALGGNFTNISIVSNLITFLVIMRASGRGATVLSVELKLMIPTFDKFEMALHKKQALSK